MSDLYLIVTNENVPVVAFANRDDADTYINISRQGSVLIPARDDLRVLETAVWRSLDKLTAQMRKVDSSWGSWLPLTGTQVTKTK